MKKTDVLISFTFAFTCILAVAFASLMPKGDEPVLVFGNPFKSNIYTVSTVVNADGLLVNNTAVSFAMIAVSDSPTFISKLYEKGAWLVVSPRALAGCFRPSKQI